MRGEGYEFDEKAEGAVTGLIGSLPRVDAPGDFNARVWGRIEKGRPQSARGLLTFLRIAVPACVLLALGGYFGYSTFYSRPTVPVIVTANEQPSAQPASATSSESSSTDHLASTARDRNDNDGKVSQDSPGQKSSRDQVATPRGGSYEETLRAGANRMPQRGLPQKPQLTDVNAAGTGAQIGIKSVLEQIGIRAEYESGGWKVESVTQNNIAEKAGVQPGDVIEALNDQVLTQKTQLGRTFTGMSLRVRRNGKIIKLDLKP